jgi:integrase
MRDVDRIRTKQRKKDRITREEIEACRETIDDDREKAMLELMLSTGLRVGEIAALRIEDIDLDQRKVHIREGKTEYAERDVYVTIKARNAIRKYIGERTSGYVFRPKRKANWPDRKLGNGTIEKIAKDIGQRAGCHCVTTVHVYRKTFASEEYKRTGNVKYVSILLGHSSTAVTEKFYLVDDMKDIEYKALYAS